MYNYQRSHSYFAQTADGLEELAAEELTRLGAIHVKPSYRGLSFQTDKAGLYHINYRARLISRVLAPLLTFDCHSDRYLYRTARKIQWPTLFPPEKTFMISAHVDQSRIRHSRYAALRLKDAIVDSYRDALGVRPSVNTDSPDIRLFLYLQKDRATIYWDTSGESLHRRHYRIKRVDAPMQETVAAAILSMSEWDEKTLLVDPMCGSGTLLAEALMMACRIPAGYLRDRFGFESLPDFDQAIWASVKTEADGGIRAPAPGLITGSDLSPDAIDAVRFNLKRLPYGETISLKTMDFREIPNLEGRIIISNPPYGIRMGAGPDMDGFMKGLGDFLKRRCTGSTAYLYFGNREAIKWIGLRPAWKRHLKSGGLDGRLVKYELY